MIGKFKEMLFDRRVDVQDRLFMLLAAIAMTGMIAAFIAGLVEGENLEGSLTTFLSILIVGVLVYVGYRHKKIRLTANIIALVIVFVLSPTVFFTSGGIYGGAPIWLVFDLLYIGMILRGRIRIVLLICEAVMISVCYYIEYNFPDTVIPHTTDEFYSDSLGSLIIVTFIMTILMIFQVYVYTRENEISIAQKEEIDALNKAQNRFFSSMSHEIRTPINTIIGLNEMILREEVSEEVAEDAVNIQAASKMLLSLINDILDMSKMQSGQMQLTNAPYHPVDMISDVVSMMQVRAREKKLEFNANISPDLPTELVGDEVRMKQVLINVLNNAIKYTKQGYVMLSVQCEKSKGGMTNVIYSVTDTGIGIKKESIPYLFTAFKRVDEEKNRYIEGTGLGLSIVKQLVDLMGGKVTVNSVYTKGSTFIVEVPQQVSDDTPIGRIEMLKRQSIDRSVLYHQSFEAPGARILAVDDTPANLMVVTKLLRETQAEIDTAGSGAEALEKTLQNEYHVILMDHMMPEMDGIECMHRIRNQIGGLSKDTKFIALTANAGSEERALYEKEGFDGYLLKPVSGDALENEVHRLLPPELVTVKSTEENTLKESASWVQSRYKKANVIIMVPSVADIPGELWDKHNIRMIPLKIETENGIFRDGIDVDAGAILSYMEDKGRKAKIKGLEKNELETFFAEQLQYANNIIHLTASGKVADTGYYPSEEASKTFDNVTVMDTMHISTGLGIMALEADRMASDGRSPEEIIQRLESMRREVHTWFIVESLDHLLKSGQMNNRIVANITKAFMIHPMIEMKRGRMTVTGIYVGAREHTWKRYISKVLRSPDKVDTSRLYITHVGLAKKDIDWIRAEVEKRIFFDEIYVTQASPAISVNVGPGTFGLLYREKVSD